MWLKVSVCLIACLLAQSIGTVNAVGWPQCGEFIFPMDDTNLSAEEKQFKQNLPSLFELYDCGNATDVERALKSLEKFKTSLTPTDKKCFEKQTLSPSQEIVSMVKFIIHIDLNMSTCILHRRSVFRATDIQHLLIK